MDYYCENCHQEVALEVDGYRILDGECPECGAPIWEDAQASLIGGLIDAATDRDR